jgi:HD-GYP domain-containing protein (c-di-GMP phosphodiesterase class II)
MLKRRGMLETSREMPSGFWKSRQLTEATVAFAVGALDDRDPWTASHSVRVAEIAQQLTMRLASGRPEIDLMRVASVLHDIGKIAVRDDVLLKPGPLTEDEWAIMRRHPDRGADLLLVHPGLAPVAPVVRHHHEHWDGSGYPGGLKGESIPLGSRIVAVAESFDFITSHPPFGPPWQVRRPEDALRDLNERAGSWYDPRVVGALFELIELGKLHWLLDNWSVGPWTRP